MIKLTAKYQQSCPDGEVDVAVLVVADKVTSIHQYWDGSSGVHSGDGYMQVRESYDVVEKLVEDATNPNIGSPEQLRSKLRLLANDWEIRNGFQTGTLTQIFK